MFTLYDFSVNCSNLLIAVVLNICLTDDALALGGKWDHIID